MANGVPLSTAELAIINRVRTFGIGSLTPLEQLAVKEMCLQKDYKEACGYHKSIMRRRIFR